MMFNVKIRDKNMQFTFSHYTNVGEEVGIQAITYCRLVINGVTFSGTAACSVHDRFDRERGRKLALARALQVARKVTPLEWVERYAIWTRYQDRRLTNAEWEYAIVLPLGPTVQATGVLDDEYAKAPKVTA